MDGKVGLGVGIVRGKIVIGMEGDVSALLG